MKTCAFITAKATEQSQTPKDQFHVGNRCAYKICNALASLFAVQSLIGKNRTEKAIGGKP